ncbi:MAG: hypothetical protein HKN41_08855 [Ilumatobacter sp.]|nr:hypothetical protein [Ilumatobacter sp.]
MATLAGMVPARDRCLPVDEAFASMLPDAGLVRGRVVGCTGPAAMSAALALASRSTVTGAWLAAVGVPMLGVEAAVELGVVPTRLVAVGVAGGPAAWAERIAAAADGFDLILTRPPAGAERTLRRVRQRLQARGTVLFAVGPADPGVSCDIEFVTTPIEWAGLGEGHGVVTGRRVRVELCGRRIPRPIERQLWLPGPDGRVATVDTTVDTTVDSTIHADRHHLVGPDVPVGELALGRAG